MNKLNKDQIQKIFLSGLMLAGLVYCYFTFLLGPLAKTEANTVTAIADLDASISQSRLKISRTRATQADAKAAGETLAQINELIPEGAPIAWFPPLIRAFFERHGFKNVASRLNGIEAAGDPGMTTYKNASWTIDVPQAKYISFGIALAGLENDQILLEVLRLDINSQPDNLEFQRVTLTVNTLLK